MFESTKQFPLIIDTAKDIIRPLKSIKYIDGKPAEVEVWYEELDGFVVLEQGEFELKY